MTSATVHLLIGRIVSALENEKSLLQGVSDEFDEIKEELTSMRYFLEDADRKGANSKGEEAWVANVRDMAHNIEDVIDEFIYHMNSIQGGGRFSCFLRHTIHIPKSLWWRHQTATKLQKINRKIKAIPERNQRYSVDRIEGKTSQDDQRWKRHHGESSLFIKEDDLVGIEDKKKQLMGWLMDEEPHQTVISIVGMGGSGKTTLVANTYTNEAVNSHFDCYAWISVSQMYDIEDLFRRMIKEVHKSRKEEVPKELGSQEYKELLEMLVRYLEQKKYLVVLDDVWEIELWRQIKISLPDSRLGSRIIFTTRKEDVARFPFGVKSHLYHIQPLGEEEAWKLFSTKALFSGDPNKCCPHELESLARELVKKCQGLPLAIVALGSLMSSKKNKSEWNQVYENLNWHLSNNPMLEVVKSILLLSFEDLPYQLKHCFLYCSLFPEDYSIRRNRLIRLWIAEGFVEKEKGFTREEVALSYLMELVFRSMLQVSTADQLVGRVRHRKPIKMHDLMRELALSISEREKFCAVYDGREAMEECKARHLSIHRTTDREFKSCTGMSKLRSFLVFDNSSKTLPLGLKMLRTLDLQYTSIYKLPYALMNLFNLRYLNLSRTSIKKLPKSIGRLCSLQTLDIRFTKIETLPSGIAKLQNLQHLLMFHYAEDKIAFKFIFGKQVPLNIIRLKNLQVLACIEARGDLIRRIGSMTQLTDIGITNVKATEEMDLCVSIQNMKLLQFLFVMVSDEEESLRMDALSSPPPRLWNLTLAGKLERVPRWFYSLQSLTYLYLRWSRLEEDLLPHIAALPYLESLILVNAYVGKCLCFSTGFLKLKTLDISNFPQLNEIIIGKGVMPNLVFLNLEDCLELKTIPMGIEYLNLQELDVAYTLMELKNRICGEDSADHAKVQHIPKIYM